MTERSTDSKPSPALSAWPWPPYGYMHTGFQWDIDSDRVPDTFLWQGRPATESEFAAYIHGEARTLADFLWPTYDRPTGRWQGAAEQQAVALTLADLELMAQLRGELFKEAQAAGRPLNATHRSLFEQEDMSAQPTLELYLPNLPAELLAALKAGITKGFGGLGTTHLRFKELFQRPRPYQVAFLLDRPFEYEFGKSAVTPSLVSGHSLQGLVVRTFGYMAARRALENHPNGVASLQQYCVDIGDRRVFAGVHYPSDNIASWYCGLRLCDYIFGGVGQVAKEFMWEAISKRSTVYGALVKAAEAASSPYRPILEKLQAEATRPVARSEDAAPAPVQPVFTRDQLAGTAARPGAEADAIPGRLAGNGPEQQEGPAPR